MSALSAVLGTVELLEIILANLSPNDITRSMRVSKTFDEVILTSRILHDARILAPLNKLYPADYPPKNEINPRPQYGIDYLHLPCCDKLGSSFLVVPSERVHYFNFSRSSLQAAQRQLRPGIEDRFMTSPPCQALGLRSAYDQIDCTVYVKDGIRVRDVLGVVGEIARTAKCYLKFDDDQRSRRGLAFVVQFSTIIDEK